MAVEWEQVIVDCADPRALGQWWAEVLGWVVVDSSEEEYEIRAAPDRLPGILFGRSTDTKVVKNRLHLDLRPDDRDAEVARLLAHGARHADVGQEDVPWVVLADPEGNEFCVLAARARE